MWKKYAMFFFSEKIRSVSEGVKQQFWLYIFHLIEMQVMDMGLGTGREILISHKYRHHI